MISRTQFTKADNIFFTRRLAFLLNSGLSLSKALDILTIQSRKAIQPHLREIQKQTETGQSLSDSLATFPKAHPAFMIHLIKAGEQSGHLHECLIHVSKELTRSQTLNKKIISASVYPILIAVGTIALSFFLIFFIFPKIKSLFSSLHSTLPLSTRIIIWLSEFISRYGLIIFVFLVVILFTLYISIQRSSTLQYKRDAVLLAIPIVGRIICITIVSNFFRIIGIMLESHIPLHQALLFASESIHNKLYIQASRTITEETASHGTLSQSLRNFPTLFPETVVQFVEVGEYSGSLSQNLIFASDMFDQEIEERIKFLMTFLEPLMMIAMGLVVGFIALSIITPIYEISQNLNH
jgi:type II secretory pathway component PulF